MCLKPRCFALMRTIGRRNWRARELQLHGESYIPRKIPTLGSDAVGAAALFWTAALFAWLQLIGNGKVTVPWRLLDRIIPTACLHDLLWDVKY